jgi:hypothetical protein
LPIAAVPHNTVPAPTTPWVNPGTYTLTLTVNGRSYTQPIVVKQDPRVKTPAVAMQQLYSLTRGAYFGAADAQAAGRQAAALRAQVAQRAAQAPAVADSLAAFDRQIVAIAGEPAGDGGAGRGGRGRGVGPAPTAAAAPTLASVEAGLAGVMNLLQGADVTPPAVSVTAMTNAQQAATAVMTRWNALKTVDLPAINAKLKAAGAEPLTLGGS